MTSGDTATTADIDAEGGTQSGPFGQAARVLYGYGLAVMPVGGEAGKRPLLKYRNLQHRPGREFIEKKLVPRFGAKNIGILTGPLSGVVVVDCDDPNAVSVMIERCGDTPLKISTPRGGVHLYYKWTSEGCANLRREGLAVDVKGAGGFVVAPPSIRPSGPYTGKAYELLSGSWADLCRLPPVRPGSLPERSDRRASQRREDTGSTSRNERSAADKDAEPEATPLRAVRQGQRNTTLFRSLLPHARHCDDVDALRDVADRVNADFESPLPDDEVAKTVASVWRYQAEGRNWSGQSGTTYIMKTEFAHLMAHKRGPDAVALLLRLRLAHWNRATFIVAPKAMAKAQVFPGWSHCRYRKARDALVELGFLQITQRGGRRKGYGCRCSFGDAAASEGQGSRPNVTKHPPLRSFFLPSSPAAPSRRPWRPNRGALVDPSGPNERRGRSRAASKKPADTAGGAVGSKTVVATRTAVDAPDVEIETERRCWS